MDIKVRRLTFYLTQTGVESMERSTTSEK